MAATEPYVRNQLYSIPLAELLPDPNQPRKFLDPAALDELAASIAQHGVLEPILFRAEAGQNFVVAGERRCSAARQAGLASIPAICIDGQNHAEIALVENLLRQDLTIPKRTLIEIARNKQQRSMTSAFAKYKTEQQKAIEEKKPRVRRTVAEGFVAALATTEDKIANLDLATLSAEEKSSVIAAADSLQQAIHAFFDQVAQ